MRTTYTYTTLEISQAAYDEIKAKLLAAGSATIIDGAIDMHGLALTRSETQVETSLTLDEIATLRNHK